MNISDEFKQNYYTLCSVLDSIDDPKNLEQKFIFEKDLYSLGVLLERYGNIYWIRISDIENNDLLKEYFSEKQLMIIKHACIFSVDNNIQSITKMPYCGGIYVMYMSKTPKADNASSRIYLAKLPEDTDCITVYKEGNFDIVKRCDNFYFLKEMN